LHSDDAPVVSLGKPRAQGADAASTGDRIIQPNDVSNYTQIWMKDVVVSGTSSVLDRYGRDGSEMAYQEMFQNKVIKKEMQNALFWGYATAAATTATAGELQGIYERLYSTSVTDLSDAALTMDNVEDAVEACQDWGGRPDTICVGLYTKRIIDAWGQAFVSHNVDPMSPANLMYGTNVSVLYVGGVAMEVLVCPDLHAHVFILDSSRLGFGPLVGANGSRALSRKDLDPGGDKQKSIIVGEYTAAIPNPRSHYMFSSVKFT